MAPEIYSVIGLGVGLVIGSLLGRRTNRVRDYARGLEEELEAQRLSQERLAAEAQAARDGLKRQRQELELYRNQVSEHFADTSELLRDLTLRYRTVYQHLAEGARELCLEGAIPLDVGLPESPLLPGAEELELEEGKEDRGSVLPGSPGQA